MTKLQESGQHFLNSRLCNDYLTHPYIARHVERYSQTKAAALGHMLHLLYSNFGGILAVHSMAPGKYNEWRYSVYSFVLHPVNHPEHLIKALFVGCTPTESFNLGTPIQ
jgi:hypothetical protein